MRTYTDYKNILELKEEGYSRSQIARKLDLPSSTVRDIIKRYPAGVGQLEESRVLKTLQCEFESRPRYQFRNYTEQDFIEAVKSSINLREVLTKLNIVPGGGNYKTLKDKIKSYGLDTSHFLGQATNKGRSHNHAHKKPLELILVKHCNYSSTALKLRLIKEEILPKECTNCKNKEWNSLPIPLELHHINGNNLDNRIENLQVLCPNCHAQTDNYRRRKIK